MAAMVSELTAALRCEHASKNGSHGRTRASVRCLAIQVVGHLRSLVSAFRSVFTISMEHDDENNDGMLRMRHTKS